MTKETYRGKTLLGFTQSEGEFMATIVWNMEQDSQRSTGMVAESLHMSHKQDRGLGLRTWLIGNGLSF